MAKPCPSGAGWSEAELDYGRARSPSRGRGTRQVSLRSQWWQWEYCALEPAPVADVVPVSGNLSGDLPQP